MDEIAKKEEMDPAVEQPANLVAMAIQRGFDADQLGKLLEMQERHEANEARKSYVKAMAEFKADPPKIVKDRQVAYSGTKYNHASLANVTTKISESLSRHGLTLSWETDQKDGQISVTCRVTHVLGHSESTTLHSNPDESGAKNEIQAVGSAVSYLQRYTALAICGLATYEQDDDAVAADSSPISENQHSTLVDLMAEHGVNEARFLKMWGINDVSELWASNFKRAADQIKQSGRRR